MIRRIAIAFFCLLLVVSLFGANAALAVDRGPLDNEHTKESIAESGLYDVIEDEAAGVVAEEVPAEQASEYDIDLDVIVASIISEDWLQTETERNIDAFYAYLDDDEELELYIDIASLEGEMQTALESEFAELDYSAFGLEELDAMLEDEEAYHTEREVLRAELLGELGMDPDEGFGNPTLASLIESEDSYAAEQEAVQAAIAEEIIDELDARNGFGDERVESLLADAASYEATQDDFRTEQKERIQEETEEELSDEQLEAAYADQQDEIREATEEELTTAFAAEAADSPVPLEDELDALAAITASALATDLSYETYTTEYHTIVDDIENEIETYVAENGDEFAPEIEERIDDEFDQLVADEEIPAPIADELDPLTDLTVEALTTDLTYDEFVAEYDDIASDIIDAGTDYVWENRGEYADDIDAAVGAHLADQNLPPSIEAEIEKFVDLLTEAVLTDLSYEEFSTAVAESETAMSDALVTELFDGEDGIPERVDITEEVDGIEEELEPLQTASGIVSGLGIALPVFSLGLLGGIYYLTTNLALTSLIGGGAAIVVGGVSYGLNVIAASILVDEIAGQDLPEELVEPVTDFVLAQLAPLGGQSLVLLGLGGGLSLVGIGLSVGLHERFVAGEGSGEVISANGEGEESHSDGEESSD